MDGWYFLGAAEYHNGVELRKTIIACTVLIVVGMLASVGVWWTLEHVTLSNRAVSEQSTTLPNNTEVVDRPGDACHPNGIFGGRFHCQ